MKYISFDCEADGPVPGLYSMISFGAIVVDKNLDTSFYSTLAPISHQWKPDALKVTGFTREETLNFSEPEVVINNFYDWLKEQSNTRLMFISDNAGFDWSFLNFYMHKYKGENPFGYSCISLTSLYKGLEKDMKASFKHLRDTKHSHNALDDARGNAEAILKLRSQIKSLDGDYDNYPNNPAFWHKSNRREWEHERYEGNS